MNGRRAFAWGAAAALCGAASAPWRPSAPLLVFAAADLREALPEVAAAYRRAGGDSVTLVFGATSDLATQIANGAPADAFFAADQAAIAGLAARRAVVGGTSRVYAVGRLALVMARGATAGGAPEASRLADLARPGVRTVVIADPAHAPYGRAARQALERAGLWDAVRAKVVYAPNVAQAYRFVVGGNADAGIVARASLGAAAPGAAYALVDTTLYAPIRQAAAVVASSAQPAAAARFVEYATGAPGFAVLRRYGFGPPPAAAAPPAAAPPAAAPRP